jgi:hypothetical protein
MLKKFVELIFCIAMSYNISHQTNILDVEKIFEKMAPDVH